MKASRQKEFGVFMRKGKDSVARGKEEKRAAANADRALAL